MGWSGPLSCHASDVAWLVSEARVLASAEVADHGSSPSPWAPQAGRPRGRAGDHVVPLGAHRRDALPPRRGLPRRRWHGGQDGPHGTAPGRPPGDQGELGDRSRSRRLRPLGPARRRRRGSPRWPSRGADTGGRPLGAGGDADREPRRPLAPRRRGVADGRARVLRGHATHRTAAATRRRGGAPARRLQRAHRARPGSPRCSPRSATVGTSRSSPTPALLASAIPANAWSGRRSTPASRSRACPGRPRSSTALVTSGLATGRFAFEGFLPAIGSGPAGPAGGAGDRAAHDRRVRGAPSGPPHARRPRRRARRRPPGRGGPGADQALGDGRPRDAWGASPRPRRARAASTSS